MSFNKQRMVAKDWIIASQKYPMLFWWIDQVETIYFTIQPKSVFGQFARLSYVTAVCKEREGELTNATFLPYCVF